MSKKKNKRRFCDPEMCDHCMYLGEGDFFCDKYEEFVMNEWEPTEDYLKCKQGERR